MRQTNFTQKYQVFTGFLNISKNHYYMQKNRHTWIRKQKKELLEKTKQKTPVRMRLKCPGMYLLKPHSLELEVCSELGLCVENQCYLIMRDQ